MSFYRWINILKQAVADKDQEMIDHCRERVFPKDRFGEPGQLFLDTLEEAKVELEKAKAKKTPKKAVSSRRRTKTSEKS